MAKFSDESFAAALSPRRLIKRYPFPGVPTMDIGIRLLTESEADGARLEAVSYCTRKKADLLADPEFLDRAIMREHLSRACYDVDTKDDAFFSSQAEVGELDNLTLRALWEIYNAHAVEMDPYAHVSLEEVEELGKSLPGSANVVARLSLCDRRTLLNLSLSLVRCLHETSQTLSSRTG